MHPHRESSMRIKIWMNRIVEVPISIAEFCIELPRVGVFLCLRKRHSPEFCRRRCNNVSTTVFAKAGWEYLGVPKGFFALPNSKPVFWLLPLALRLRILCIFVSFLVIVLFRSYCHQWPYRTNTKTEWNYWQNNKLNNLRTSECFKLSSVSPRLLQVIIIHHKAMKAVLTLKPVCGRTTHQVELANSSPCFSVWALLIDENTSSSRHAARQKELVKFISNCPSRNLRVG